jgi:uncharacterized damage-inducible protein DinB
MQDPLREQIARILDWTDAHAGLGDALEGIPAKLRGLTPEGSAHSLWQLLEHMRLAQFDILDFCRNADYTEPSSMDEYWPRQSEPAPGAWDTSIASFWRDLNDLRQLALNPDVDPFATIPHGDGQTYLRELLLVADHNSYHLGQVVALRRQLGIWR